MKSRFYFKVRNDISVATLTRIIRMESCAGSSSMIEVVHNPENDKFGIYITDEAGYTDLIALNRDQVEILLKTVSDYVEGKS